MIEKADLSDNAISQIVKVVKPFLEEKDKEIERLNNIINDLLSRIAILEREVEEHEGF